MTAPTRFSYLKHMARSPAHYLHATTEEWDGSIATRIGTAAHAILFDQPLISYDRVRRGKEWDAFQAEHAGKAIVSIKEYETGSAIATAVRANPLAADLLFSPGTVHERTIEWEWLGRSVTSTPDAYSTAGVIELKTTRCSEPGRFTRDATWRAYHAQLALYRLAIGMPALPGYIVSVESAPPHVVTVLKLTDRALEMGERQCRLWMERLLQCEASGLWPGYCQSIVDLDVPDDEVGLVFEDD